MSISGLRFIPQFLAKAEHSHLEQKAHQLHHHLQNAVTRSTQGRARTYLSQQHNLESHEAYRLVSLDDLGQKINAQYFKNYGDSGHQLSYFIGNKNIPSFIQDTLIPPLEIFVSPPLMWNFTFNAYLPSESHLRPGFPFHIDTPTNGDSTFIYTLLSEATLEMKKGTDVRPILLTPGSLLQMSGPARWDWQHRIVPRAIPFTDREHVDRMSLVLGCKPQNVIS